MQSADAPDRNAIYRRVLDLMERSFELADPLTVKVTIPFRDTTLPAYFTRPTDVDGRTPCMIMWNGLDSTKEHMYLSGFCHELARRGIATLMVDCPGSGEALRLQGLTAQIATEEWAAACVDYLETIDTIDADRIGLVGWSLGGYYAPRAAAFEKRLALCVAWGANHDWGKVQRRRVDREGERPVPHYWEHVMWVWGHDDLDEFLDFADAINLDGVVENITRALPDRTRRKRPADSSRIRPPLVRAGHRQPETAATDLHRRRGRRRTRRSRSPAARERFRRRLGRRHLHRTRRPPAAGHPRRR